MTTDREVAEAMTVRDATSDDVEALTTLYHDAYAETVVRGLPASAAWVEEETVAEWVREDHVLVAAVGEELVGAVRLTDHEGWDRPVLTRLGVASEWKRQGIGTRLMDEAESRAREDAWDRIRLTVARGHPYLVEWYRERGYEVVGLYELDDRPYDEHVMEKALGGCPGES